MAGKVLIFGGGGQVGRALQRADSAARGIPLRRAEADVTDPEAVSAALQKHQPVAVINAAVFQPVDLCESEVSQAFAVNATGAAWVAAACAEHDVPLVHISTDYVFGGERSEPYVESDCPEPVSAYARSKLAGEHAVLSSGPRHCVVRTSSVYSAADPDSGTAPFVERMLERAVAGETTRVVDDQVVSPTYAHDLADALWRIVDNPAGGLLHLAGSTPATWYDVAEALFAAAGRSDLLSRTTSAEFAAPAPRAPYTALASERLGDFGVDPLPGWRDGLARHLAAAHPELG